MKALSVRAPWWWAIMHGKPVENRDWSTNFRGLVWLHASKSWKKSEVAEDWEDVRYMAEEDGISIPHISDDQLRASGGCIVGSVLIVDCVTSHPSAFFVGKHGFVLQNPVMLPVPIPLKGALGFFDVPEGLIGDAA